MALNLIVKSIQVFSVPEPAKEGIEAINKSWTSILKIMTPHLIASNAGGLDDLANKIENNDEIAKNMFNGGDEIDFLKVFRELTGEKPNIE